jgi:hypothetical protein
MTASEAYDELYADAMHRPRPPFVLQHVVDAFGAQGATDEDKPIRLVFALVGLFLHVEMGWSGVQVQRAHLQLAARKTTWPSIALPVDRGRLTAADVLSTPPGDARDRAIDAWCESVWSAFAGSRDTIVALLRDHAIISD